MIEALVIASTTLEIPDGSQCENLPHAVAESKSKDCAHVDKNLDCGITQTHELEVSSCKETGGAESNVFGARAIPPLMWQNHFAFVAPWPISGFGVRDLRQLKSSRGLHPYCVASIACPGTWLLLRPPFSRTNGM